VTVHRLREPDSWLAELPVLMLEATASAETVKRYFPTIEHVAAPALPHQHVHLVLGGLPAFFFSR
jgi:hypothetical protein